MGETRAVVEDKRIAVAAEDKGHIECLGIGQGLLHTTADGMSIVLGFDHGNGQVGLVEQ